MVVRLQELAEMEEVIAYLQDDTKADRRQMIRETWSKRIRGCQKTIEVWQRLLKIRSLVLSPDENIEGHVRFANICRKNERYRLGGTSAGPGAQCQCGKAPSGADR